MITLIAVTASLMASFLLIDPRSVFYLDWNNHLWFMEYYGECIKHFIMPGFLNTKQLVGMPDLLFYAQKFYTLSGVVCALIGSTLTIRLMIGATFLLQFFHIYRASKKLEVPSSIAISIAVFVTWAIYPLTNLYNRSALTEFFAVALLTCATASFLCVILNKTDRNLTYDIIASGFFFVAAAITHPLTALFGGIFLGLLAIIALIFSEGNKKSWLSGYFLWTVVISLLILSPWIYLVSRFNTKLPIASHENNAKYFHQQYYFPHSIDNVFSRLSPFPLDLSSIKNGIQDQASTTPYIDAQITLPLILMMGVLIYIYRREDHARSLLNKCEYAVIWASGLVMIMVFGESLWPPMFDWMGGVFNILQFPYRLVTYVNLSALVMVIILASRMGKVNVQHKQLINICVAICLAISLCALVQKLVHASAIEQRSTKTSKEIWAPLPGRSTNHLNELPASYYGVGAYTVKDGFEKGSVSGEIHYTFRNFNVLDGFQFGQVEPLVVNLSQPTLVITNVQAFPWNQIVINGVTQYPYSIISVGGRGAVLLPEGNYRLELLTKIDDVWKYLNILSWILFLGWIVLYGVVAVKEVIGAK